MRNCHLFNTNDWQILPSGSTFARSFWLMTCPRRHTDYADNRTQNPNSLNSYRSMDNFQKKTLSSLLCNTDNTRDRQQWTVTSMVAPRGHDQMSAPQTSTNGEITARSVFSGSIIHGGVFNVTINNNKYTFTATASEEYLMNDWMTFTFARVACSDVRYYVARFLKLLDSSNALKFAIFLWKLMNLRFVQWIW